MITIKVEPQPLQPVYNPIMVVLDSTNKTKPQHQYIVDLEVNGSSVLNKVIQQDPNGYGIFDLSKNLQSYVTFDLKQTTDVTHNITDTYNSFCTYGINLSEKYVIQAALTYITNNSGFAELTFSGDPGFVLGDVVRISGTSQSVYNNKDMTILLDGIGVYITDFEYAGVDSTGGTVSLSNGEATTFSSSTKFSSVYSTTNRVASNMVLDWKDFTTYSSAIFDGQIDNGFRFLTSLTNYEYLTPVTQATITTNNFYEVRPNSRLQFNVADLAGGFVDGYIQKYDSNGNKIGVIADMTRQAVIDPNRIIKISCGPYDINNNTTTLNYLTGATFYTVIWETNDTFNEKISATYKFKIVDSCSKYEDYQLLFMDRLGSFLPVHFDLVSKKDVSMDKVSYRKNIGSFDSVSNTYGYNTYDRNKTRLTTDVNKIYSITSNWVSESQARIIEEMLASPEVYHINNENGKAYAINIITSSYTEKKQLDDKLINFEIQFEYSNKDAQQNG